VEIQVPVWFPADPRQGDSIAAFWQSLEHHVQYGPQALDSVAKKAAEKSVGMKMIVDGIEIPFSFFWISGGSEDNIGVIPEKWRERGYQVLLFSFTVPLGTISNSAPVMISYRQPLLRSAQGNTFFYLPIFEHLPRDRSLDTNRYSITLTAVDCDLTVMNGAAETRIKAGSAITAYPRHLQAIRARVRLRAATAQLQKTTP
jgi:hypothetical protein